MKKNFNPTYFKGIATGLIIGIVSFSLISATFNSEAESVQPTEISSASAIDPVTGGFTTANDVSSKVAAFTNTFIKNNNLPSNTTIGGVIGEANLRDITSMYGKNNVKFRFYYTSAEKGSGNIGLVFYDPKDPNKVLMTGSTSFCPNMCD